MIKRTIKFVCIKDLQEKLKTIGHVNVANACRLIWANKEPFPTEGSKQKQVIAYLRKHAPQCINYPPKAFVNNYKSNHTTATCPEGERPEANYIITATVIENMRVKFTGG